MILYHGSNIEVKIPKLIFTNKGKDFGTAFYLTPIKEQAERMARRKSKMDKTGIPTISVFEWNEDISDLSFKDFKNNDNEWLNMILMCRKNLKYNHGYDIVKGKIADDKVGITISLVLEGMISIEDAIKKLKYQKINSQFAFCTEKSLISLRFIKSYEVSV